MKKTFYPVILLVFLTGCAKIDENKIIKSLGKDIPETNIEMTFKDKTYTGTFSKSGHITLSLVSQNIKEPLIFKSDDNICTLNSGSFETGEINENSPAVLLYEAFEKLGDGDFYCLGNKINLSNPPYEAEFDKETLKIEKLYFPMGEINFLSKIMTAT